MTMTAACSHPLSRQRTSGLLFRRVQQACFLALFVGIWAGDYVHASDDTQQTDTKQTDGDSPLSVAPLDHKHYAESRPDWVDQPPSRVDGVDLLPVSSIPCRDEKLCEEALNAAMRAATITFAESLTNDEASESWLELTDQWIADRSDANKRYHGQVTIGNETLYESATVLRFREQDRAEILQQWEQQQVGQRLVVLVGGGSVMLAGLIGGAALLSLIVRRAELRVTS